MNSILFKKNKSKTIESSPEYARDVINENVKAVKIIFKYWSKEVKIEKTIIKKDFILCPGEEILKRILFNRYIEFNVVFILNLFNYLYWINLNT